MIIPRYHRFEAVESTNDTALDMARRGEPEETVVLADRQARGRGRRGRVWLDEPGSNVLMSVILRPALPPESLPQLSFVASLAAAELLRSVFGIDAMLKWPNDVLVGGKKIAGILVEILQGRECAAVAGIGVNVNQIAFPEEIAAIATSVAIETGQQNDTGSLAEALAGALFADYEAYLAHGFEEISHRWRKYMWGVGRLADVVMEGERVRGMIAGLDGSGALVLRCVDGKERLVHAAESVRLVE